MRVFLCWSGSRSKSVAEALQGWLRRVIQAAEPWISEDIEKGTRWNPEVAARLEESRVGIVCLTRDNLDSTWVHFEAGALSKTKDAHVCTFLLDLQPSDVQQPLGQFQHTTKDKDDVRRLVVTINRAVEKCGEKALADELVDDVFDTYWPQLQARLDEIIRSPAPAGQVERSDREILTEILEILRNQERRQAAQQALRERSAALWALKRVRVGTRPPADLPPPPAEVSDRIVRDRLLELLGKPTGSSETEGGGGSPGGT